VDWDLGDVVTVNKKKWNKILRISNKKQKIWKNKRNLLKNKELSKVMSTEFQTRFSVYLTMRESVTALLLKDFNKFNFNECDAYAEIFNINPVMFNLLKKIAIWSC